MTTDHALLKPLDAGECFLLDLEGHKTVAVRLPANVASEISGEGLLPGGLFAKLKSGLGIAPETESWLAVTSLDNPLLEELDSFKALLARHLTDATGRTVTKLNLTVSASVPVNGKEQLYNMSEDDDG